VLQESSFFFGAKSPSRCPRRPGSTLGVLKPHLITDGRMGSVIAAIAQRFTVNNMRHLSFTRAQAAEFLEVYRGVLPASDSTDMVDELSSGPCLALEVSDGCGPRIALTCRIGFASFWAFCATPTCSPVTCGLVLKTMWTSHMPVSW
jgi:Nucleoside diphosphate kinase